MLGSIILNPQSSDSFILYNFILFCNSISMVTQYLSIFLAFFKLIFKLYVFLNFTYIISIIYHVWNPYIDKWKNKVAKKLSKLLECFNHQRYHESLKNVTPADMYYGRQEQILKQRELTKKESLKRRRQLFLKEKYYI